MGVKIKENIKDAVITSLMNLGMKILFIGIDAAGYKVTLQKSYNGNIEPIIRKSS